mgnify:CR=1 FL=1
MIEYDMTKIIPFNLLSPYATSVTKVLTDLSEQDEEEAFILIFYMIEYLLLTVSSKEVSAIETSRTELRNKIIENLKKNEINEKMQNDVINFVDTRLRSSSELKLRPIPRSRVVKEDSLNFKLIDFYSSKYFCNEIEKYIKLCLDDCKSTIDHKDLISHYLHEFSNNSYECIIHQTKLIELIIEGFDCIFSYNHKYFEIKENIYIIKRIYEVNTYAANVLNSMVNEKDILLEDMTIQDKILYQDRFDFNTIYTVIEDLNQKYSTRVKQEQDLLEIIEQTLLESIERSSVSKEQQTAFDTIELELLKLESLDSESLELLESIKRSRIMRKQQAAFDTIELNIIELESLESFESADRNKIMEEEETMVSVFESTMKIMRNKIMKEQQTELGAIESIMRNEIMKEERVILDMIESAKHNMMKKRQGELGAIESIKQCDNMMKKRQGELNKESKNKSFFYKIFRFIKSFVNKVVSLVKIFFQYIILFIAIPAIYLLHYILWNQYKKKYKS